MNERRRIHVNERDFMGGVSITLIRYVNGKRHIEHWLPGRGIWQITPIETGAILPNPTMVLDGDDAIELYKELHQFFSARDVKNKQESFMEGELAGTKKHLADMRYLLKLPGLIPVQKEG